MLTINTMSDAHTATEFQKVIVAEATENRRPNLDGRTRRHQPELRTYVFRGWTLTEEKGGRQPVWSLRNPSGEYVINNNDPWVVCTNYLWCVFDGV